jgi:hypothetical protein
MTSLISVCRKISRKHYRDRERERERDRGGEREREREKERDRENKDAVKGNDGNWGIISSFRICTCAAMTLCNRNNKTVKTMILGV